ncbi:MAG TPA: hypothetical protein VJP02_16215 [Candidatus Sulfotelmatobacter sp.]|nr:hypothetical protein [Candidatus Sulfotelmatobacter sp.]
MATKNYEILIENHGVVTCDPNVTTAYQRLEAVRQIARPCSLPNRLAAAFVPSRESAKVDCDEVALWGFRPRKSV